MLPQARKTGAGGSRAPGMPPLRLPDGADGGGGGARGIKRQEGISRNAALQGNRNAY